MIQNPIFVIFFLNIISGTSSSGHYQTVFFFSFFFLNFRFSGRKSQSQQKLAEKVTYLTNSLTLKTSLVSRTSTFKFSLDIENNML